MERVGRSWSEADMLKVSGSRRFAAAMAAAGPFTDAEHAVLCARRIWLDEVDVNGWLEGISAHPAIGATSPAISQWCKDEQSAAAASATASITQELLEWNDKYRRKFGFVFVICASGKSAQEILAELKRRSTNRPIVELELAAKEELKIIELRLAKLFSVQDTESTAEVPTNSQALQVAGGNVPQRMRPPITTHVLDVARGMPAPGLEIHLEMWSGAPEAPSIFNQGSAGWLLLGSSVTNSDGRSGPLLGISERITPGIYRVSFNTGKYAPSGFFPYVSIVFEIRENQTLEHFHVPLLFSPFSFTTYRGS